MQHLRTSHMELQFASKIPVAEQGRHYGFLGEVIQQKICLAVYAFFKSKVTFLSESGPGQNRTWIIRFRF